MDERLKDMLEEIKYKHFYEKEKGIKKLNESDIEYLIQTIEQQQEEIERLRAVELSVEGIIKHSEEKDAEIERLKSEHKQVLAEVKSVITEAIESLDKGEKVNGLEWAESYITSKE